jgi:hypothetical protein
MRRLLIGSVAVIGFATTGQAQQVTLNFDDLGPCSGTPLSTYGGWLALSSGVTCQTGPYSGWLYPKSGTNYMRSAGSMSWSFLGGPVVFNGMYASGYGSYFLELLNGGNTVHSGYFAAYGGPVAVSPGFAGQVDGVRIQLVGGYSHLGVDNVAFTPTVDPTTNLVNQPVA